MKGFALFIRQNLANATKGIPETLAKRHNFIRKLCRGEIVKIFQIPMTQAIIS